MSLSAPRNDSPGAVDNATGVIAALVAADVLRDRTDIGVLITDHNVRETLAICDRAYILNAGLVIADGQANDILANDQVREVYLGKDFKI